MLATLLATVYAVEGITATIVTPPVSVVANMLVAYPSAVQPLPSVNAGLFEQYESTASITVPSPSIDSVLTYHDALISASATQPLPQVVASLSTAMSMQASITAPLPRLSTDFVYVFMTAPNAIQVMTRDRILRSIRNSGGR